MDREFKSKVGWWYHLVMIMVSAGCVATFLSTNVWAMVTMLLAAALTFHVFMNTWYRITADNFLVVHCSIFPEKRIAIADIETVEATTMPVSSYALSLDRLIIWTDGKPWMLVSPRNKKEFVNLLKRINPGITIKS